MGPIIAGILMTDAGPRIVVVDCSVVIPARDQGQDAHDRIVLDVAVRRQPPHGRAIVLILATALLLVPMHRVRGARLHPGNYTSSSRVASTLRATLPCSAEHQQVRIIVDDQDARRQTGRLREVA